MSIQSSADLFKLFDKLVSKPYHINRFFVKIAGSITDGYLLTQLTYLFQQADYEPFSPRDEYLREKYDFGDKELRGARSRLKAKGLISTKLKGVPAKLHYTINTDKIMQLALELPAFKSLVTQPQEEDSSLPKRDKLERTKGTNSSAQNRQTINNTSNNIFNNNKENKQKKDSARPQVADAVSLVFEYWRKIMNHPKAVLDKKRKRHLEEALAKYSVDELKQAIDGCASNEWYMGKNDRGTVFDAIHVIFKDSDKIEGFIRMAFVKPKPIPTKSDYHQNVSNAFANVMLELSCVGGLAHGAV